MPHIDRLQPFANGLLPGTVVVTGATAGFGRAIVQGLHEVGFHVVALGRRKERLEELGLCNLFSVNFRGVGHDAGVTG